MVLIDVEVMDKSGKPVKGLKQDQFTVLEDNRPQTISSFDYSDIEGVETAGTGDTAPVVVALAGGASPEATREQVRNRRLIVLFFDMTSLQPEDLLRARAAALKFIRERMTAADLVGVVAFGNRLGVLCDFTNDKDALLKALTRLAPGADASLSANAAAPAQEGEQDVSEDVGAAFTADETEFNVFNTDRKLAAMQGLATLLKNIPGKKVVLQFTSGITQTGEENRTQVRATTDAANRSDVSFYTVDARGLLAQIPGGDASSDAASGTSMFSGASVYRQTEARQDSRETLETLADDTGGRAFFDLGNLADAFQRVQQDYSGYYLVGYYSRSPKRDGSWRDVKVKVNAPGAHVRFRQGYYAPKDYTYFTEEDKEKQIEDAMASQTPLVQLPVALEIAAFRLNDKQLFVPIAAKLPSSALAWAQKHGRHEDDFDFAAEVHDASNGRTVAALRDAIHVNLDAEHFAAAQGRALLYQGGVILPAGSYKMKFLARDNESGRIGTFEEDFILPPDDAKQLTLSSVLLSSQIVPVEKSSEVQTKAIGTNAKMAHSPLEVSGQRIVPSVTRVFTKQQTLYVFFQATYPEKSDPASLRAGLEFFRNGVRTSATSLAEPAEVDAKNRTAAFRISLPLEKLPLGRYTVEAVAIEAGTTHAAFGRANLVLQAGASPAAAPSASAAPQPR